MSESKHTPGPWFVSDTGARIGNSTVRDRLGKAICTFPWQNGNRNDDARAIAALPDMEAALKEVVRLHEKPIPIDQHRDPEILWLIMQGMADAARAAIAKAEGQS